jgi:hypothetical protein
MIFRALTIKLTILLTCFSIVKGFTQITAIKNIARLCSTTELRNHVFKLASKEMQGRMFASHGDTLAARYIADWFKAENLTAPYDNGSSYYQTISATRFDDHTVLYLNGQALPELDGWQLFPNLPYKEINLPVIITSFQSIAAWDKNIQEMDLSGKAVIINYRLFADLNRTDSLEMALKQKGVKLVIWCSPRSERVINLKRSLQFLPHYQENTALQDLSPLPEVSLGISRLQQLLKADNITVNTELNWTVPGNRSFYQLKTTIGVERQRKYTRVTGPNVIGVIKGTDVNSAAVIVSAHHDHDGMNGDTIYYGAIDNASGTAAILEVASLFNKALKAGYKPKRTVIFASYTGEERGMLGSFYFADHPLVPIKNTYAVMNFDMLGRPDTIHLKNKAPDSLNFAYILVRDTLNRGLRKSLVDANTAVNLNLDAYYEQAQYAQRRVIGSDQYPFYVKGVPFVRIDCGFVKEYHKPQDTPDKLNYELLTKQTKLAFLTLWNICSN